MEKDEIQSAIGEWLAAGLGDEDIVSALKGKGLTEKEALSSLKDVYVRWRFLREELDIDDNGQTDWHIFLRKRILQSSIEHNTVASLRLALATLDSLANIQGIAKIAGPQLIPIPMVLKPIDEEEARAEAEGEIKPVTEPEPES